MGKINPHVHNKNKFSFELIYIYMYIGSDSNVNSFFIVNVRTTKIAPHDI